MRPATALFALISVLVGSCAQAESINDRSPSTTAMTHAMQRAVLSLNGEWKAIVDPYDTGSLNYQSVPRGDGYWKDRKPNHSLELVEYSFDDSFSLEVPGDWNSQRDELFLYEGSVWYRRNFERPEGDGRFFVRIGAANRRSSAWLNGERVGNQPVGFTPGVYEITDTLKAGENTLVVRVNNSRDPTGVPGMLTDWWNYGGITRSVDILQTPETFVRNASLTTNPDLASVTGVIETDGGAEGMMAEIALANFATTIEIEPGKAGSFEIATPGIQLWSPADPALHDFTVTLRDSMGAVVDEWSDRVGVRTIETDGGRVLLNGEPILFHGICTHEEALSRPGRSWSEADARELLTAAKELGSNFVRLAHYTHAEPTLRLADEMGLLVWAEVPVYWTLDYENPTTLAEAEAHVAQMIERDANRASVVIWSVGNETGDSPERVEFRTRLVQLVRELDPSRLISAALQARQVREAPGAGLPGSAGARLVKMIVDDPFGAEVDVLGINSYIGWYHDRPDEIGAVKVELAYDKPLLISEFGAGALQGLRGDREEMWTEDHQAWLYEETLDWAEGLPNFVGLSPWILKDFRSPRRVLPGVQDFWNRKGVLSEQGRRKLAWDVLHSRYERWAATPVGDLGLQAEPDASAR